MPVSSHYLAQADPITDETCAKLVEVQGQLDLLLSDRDRYHQIYLATPDYIKPVRVE